MKLKLLETIKHIRCVLPARLGEARRELLKEGRRPEANILLHVHRED